MDTVEKLIRNLIIEIDSDSPIYDKQFKQISPSIIEFLKSPLGLFRSTITIYYPISRYNEFDPIPVTYEVTPNTTAWQIIQTIRNFYKMPVSESNIKAYMEKFQAYHIFLNRRNVTLKDLMFGATYISEIIPYNEGYLVKLKG